MSKKKRKQDAHEQIERQSEYYKLNTQAVDDLVNADESNSPEVSPEELRSYQSGGKFKIPHWLKMIFIKFWFPGAVCFFFLWGLGNYIGNMLDQLFVTGMALGIVTDVMTNTVLRFLEKNPGENSPFMMFPKKGYASFPLNILYAYLLLFLEFCLYSLINWTFAQITGDTETLFLGVEPVLFGLFYMGLDSLLIAVKHYLQSLWKRGRTAERGTDGSQEN